MDTAGQFVPVTGASGSIGGDLAKQLLQKGVRDRAVFHYDARGRYGCPGQSELRDKMEIDSGNITTRTSTSHNPMQSDAITGAGRNGVDSRGAGAPRRRIRVVTAAPSEYGLLYWLPREIDEDPELQLQIVVTGAHLKDSTATIVRAIERDGFHIRARVDMVLASDRPIAVGKSISLFSIGFAQALFELPPDALVVMGDRYELLPIVSVALVAGLPIEHISGGDVTKGTIDNQVRHALTKTASLHFLAVKESARRIIQTGEDLAHVWVVGQLGLDNIVRLDNLDRKRLADDLGLRTSNRWILLTYHTETLAPPCRDMSRLRTSLEALGGSPEVEVVMTWPNSDPGGLALGSELQKWADEQPSKLKPHRSLGQRRYLSLMHEAACMVGNSPSGILEAPSIPLPVVDIGDRQTGRFRSANVIHVPEDEGIVAALDGALSPGFRTRLRGLNKPYGEGSAAPRMKECLKTVELEGLCRKGFHDLGTSLVQPGGSV